MADGSGESTQLIMVMSFCMSFCVFLVLGCYLAGVTSIEKFFDILKPKTSTSDSSNSNSNNTDNSNTNNSSNSDSNAGNSSGNSSDHSSDNSGGNSSGNAPPPTTTAAPGTGTATGGDWKCVQSCTDNMMFVNVNKNGTTYRCSGPDGNTCEWFPACPTATPKDTGRACNAGDFEGEGWCKNAKKVFESNETISCTPAPNSTLRPTGTGAASVCDKSGTNQCASYCCHEGHCSDWAKCFPLKEANAACGFANECKSNQCVNGKCLDCPNGRCA